MVYLVFKTMSDLTKYIEERIKELDEAKRIIKSETRNGRIHAIDASTLAYVDLNSRELLSFLNRAIKMYKKILSSLPSPLDEAEWLAVMELNGGVPTRVYIVPVNVERGLNKPGPAS